MIYSDEFECFWVVVLIVTYLFIMSYVGPRRGPALPAAGPILADSRTKADHLNGPSLGQVQAFASATATLLNSSALSFNGHSSTTGYGSIDFGDTTDPTYNA